MTAAPRLRLVSALLLIASVARPLAAQSLAELAKKEEERRKAIAVPARVYTNKDLNAAPPPATPPAAAPAATPADAAKAAADKAKAAGADKSATTKDQAYWSGRMKELQTQVERDQTYADAMQTKLNSLNTDFVNRDDPVQRAGIERERQKTTAELARLQQSVVAGKKSITDLEEEARRAGVPPGWLR